MTDGNHTPDLTELRRIATEAMLDSSTPPHERDLVITAMDLHWLLDRAAAHETSPYPWVGLGVTYPCGCKSAGPNHEPPWYCVAHNGLPEKVSQHTHTWSHNALRNPLPDQFCDQPGCRLKWGDRHKIDRGPPHCRHGVAFTEYCELCHG